MEGGGGMGRGGMGITYRGEFYLRSNYRLGRRIGWGVFSKVIVAEHELTGHKVAIKVLNREKIRAMGSQTEELVRREIKISVEMMRLFTHPHIIRVYEVIQTPTDIFVVMEYMKCGDLFEYILVTGRLHEDHARRYFQQIVSGVEHLHRNMLVHRDLKPDNLLLDAEKSNVKIADFGLSNVLRDGHCLKTMCGTPNYAAPELLSQNWYAGPEIDVWSCGVILYVLLCALLPFDEESIPNLYNKIKAGMYTLPSHLSAGARDLISRMLRVDPLQRVTIPEIRQHPWFQARLPRYLALPSLDTNQQAKRIDEHILHELSRVGFNRNELIESLREGVQSEETVAYYLMLDNRYRISHTYLGEEFQEGRDEVAQGAHIPAHIPAHIMDILVQRQAMGIPPRALTQFARRAQNHHRPRRRRGLSPSAGFRAGFEHMVHPQRPWTLGLQSGAPPRQIMMTVLKSLNALGISWRNVGNYGLKCRWVPPAAAISRAQRPSTSYSGMVLPGLLQSLPNGLRNGFSNSTMLSRSSPAWLQLQRERSMITAASNAGSAVSPRDSEDHYISPGDHGEEHKVVKFEVQLYKARAKNYLLDVQREEGSHFVFLDLCASFISEFRIPQTPRGGMEDDTPLYRRIPSAVVPFPQ